MCVGWFSMLLLKALAQHRDCGVGLPSCGIDNEIFDFSIRSQLCVVMAKKVILYEFINNVIE